MTIESAILTSEVAIRHMTGLYGWGRWCSSTCDYFLAAKGNETAIGRIDNTPVPQFLIVLFLGRLAWWISSVGVIDSVWYVHVHWKDIYPLTNKFSRQCYQRKHQPSRLKHRRTFLFTRFRSNLSLILPWICRYLVTVTCKCKNSIRNRFRAPKNGRKGVLHIVLR